MSSKKICSCDGSSRNLGTTGCLPELGAPKDFWISPTFNEAGNRIALDPSVTLDLAYMTTFLRNENSRDRIYPALDVKAFVPEKADPTTEEAPSGSIAIVKQGSVSHSFTFWTNDPYTYKALFENMSCLDNQVMIPDTEGNLIGEETEDGKLAGRRIETNSMVVTVEDHTFESVAKVTVKFNYRLDSGDEKVSYIKASDFASDYNTSTIKPLLDAQIEFVGTPTQTGGTFKLFLLWGSIGNKVAIPSFTPTELIGYNETTPGTVTLITCTDAVTEGTYVYTHASQTATNVFHIQGNAATIQKDIDTKEINAVSVIL